MKKIRRPQIMKKPIRDRVFLPILLFLLAFLCLSVSAQDRKVYDYAQLLSESEAEDLQQRLSGIADTWSYDVAVLTVPSTNGKTPESFARESYQGLGYGYDSDDRGVLFLLAMDERDWYATFFGKAQTTINSYGLSMYEEHVVPLLSDGDYYDAFMKYADITEDFIRQAEEKGTPYGYDGNTYKVPMAMYKRILIAVGAGLVATVLTFLILWSQLTSVKAQDGASEYVVPGSFHLQRHRDMFLYKTHTKTRIERHSGGGGGGGHSGHSSSGGGGKF